MDASAAGTLRVNLLEQCQLRCAYCLPGTVRPFTANPERLTVAEYRRIARCLTHTGIRKVRFTGGEPLLHPEVEEIVRAFRQALPSAHLAVTTNGLRLESRLERLVDAGLSGATVHLDSLRPHRYRELMGEGDVDAVLSAAVSARRRLERVKFNCVVQRGKNDDELWDFLTLSRQLGIEVRFIELMNTGSAVLYTRRHFVSGAELISLVAQREQVRALSRRHHADPAALYQTASGIVFGVIASDTTPFCADCDRLRLTPDGRLRGCLYEAQGVKLGAALRRGATDEDLRTLVLEAVHRKKSFHPALEARTHAFSMSEVGG